MQLKADRLANEIVSRPPFETSNSSTSTIEATTPNSKSPDMEFNIAAGVFMILMIALVASLLLCCCKTYIICRKRLRRRSNEIRRTPRGRSIHNNLPVSGAVYGDEPPSYADVTFGQARGNATDEGAVTYTNINVADLKIDEDEIAVYWSNEGTVQNNELPVCQCQELRDDPPPPEYRDATRPVATTSGLSHISFRTEQGQQRTRTRGLSQTLRETIHTLSVIVSRRREAPPGNVNQRTTVNVTDEEISSSISQNTSHVNGSSDCDVGASSD